MKNLSGAVAAVSGAASGIGQALALRLARDGCHLALSDLNEVGLAETVAMVEKYGVKVSSQTLDVADRAAVYDWAQRVVDEHGKVNIVINNAGVALNSAVESITYEDFEWLMNINFWGVVYGSKAFLPHIEAAGEGNIVNISSVFGMIGVPGQAAYNSAKFAVKGFTECFIQELNLAGSPVRACCVHPGGIKTNIAGNARVRDDKVISQLMGGEPGERSADERTEEFHKMAPTTADGAADTIVAGILKDKRRVLIGRDAWLIDKVQRLLPLGYQRLLERRLRRMQTAG